MCLMDIPDDWGKEYDIALYERTYDAAINELGPNEMWNDASPIWLRPQHSNMRLYKPQKLLQVVGHTPMDMITKEGNLISYDVFSTYRDGKPIGAKEFLLLDTETWECIGIKKYE